MAREIVKCETDMPVLIAHFYVEIFDISEGGSDQPPSASEINVLLFKQLRGHPSLLIVSIIKTPLSRALLFEAAWLFCLTNIHRW